MTFKSMFGATQFPYLLYQPESKHCSQFFLFKELILLCSDGSGSHIQTGVLRKFRKESQIEDGPGIKLGAANNEPKHIWTDLT